MNFNLSKWSLKHRSFTIYCMIALVVAGAMSYLRLGRNEDPAFTFRTMVVFAGWPGADLNETLKQVTERLERTLQETPSLDHVESYTKAGGATIFVTLKGETPPSKVPDVWYHVRKSVADMRHTLPAGVVGPGFNDEFGDTYGIIYGFTADGFSHRELRNYVEDIRSKLLQVPDVSKIELLGEQDERDLSSSSRPRSSQDWGSTGPLSPQRSKRRTSLFRPGPCRLETRPWRFGRQARSTSRRTSRM